MRETFDEAMTGVKVGLVRGDNGFYTDGILSTLEDRSLNYIIAARAYTNLKHEVYGMKDWGEVCPGIAVKEWRHQPAGPKPQANCSSRTCPSKSALGWTPSSAKSKPAAPRRFFLPFARLRR